MKNYRKAILTVIGLMIASILGYLIYRSFRPDFELLFDPDASREAFAQSIREHGLQGALLLVCSAIVFYMIPGLSNSVICVFIGVCYGPWVGILLNLFSNLTANSLLYLVLSKNGFSRKIQKNASWLDKLDHMTNPLFGLTIGYMVPIIPSILVNFAANNLSKRFPIIFISMFVGALPLSVLYAFGGDALLQGNHLRAILFLVVAALLILVIVLYLRLNKKNQQVSS